MIVNETVISEEDSEFLVQCMIDLNERTARRKISKAIGWILCIVMLIFTGLLVWAICSAKSYHAAIPTNTYFYALFYAAIGIICLILLVFGKKIVLWRTMHSKAWNTTFGMMIRTAFDGDTITSYRSTVGTDTESHYALNLLEGYTEQNGSLYLWLRTENQIKFMVLHDNGYTEGTKAELIALLQKNSIPLKQKP